ncbi:MAG: Tad domain-containing protein [Silicimonas sp.]|nr:Tad domain-containing protein [Silicimonas sp.]
MIRRLLSRRRKGAMAMVAIAGMVPVTAMMSANFNTSQMVDDRRQVQDAADSLSTTHGVWSARALNIISMNNVTTAQLLSVAVGSEALFFTTAELTTFSALATTHILTHEGTHCPPRSREPITAAIEAVIWSAPCVAWHTAVNVPAALAASRAADINSDFDPVHGIKTATKALEAIDGMNRALLARHPRAMSELAESYRSILDIDDHHFADPCNGFGVQNCRQNNSRDGMALPLEEAQILTYGKLWQVMMTGTTAVDTTFRTRGFPFGKGPLTDGGTQRRPHLSDHINHVTGIGTALYDFKRFYSSRIAHLPRHPLAGPGNAFGGSNGGPGDPEDEESPFNDDTTDLLDTLTEVLEDIDDITQSVLRVLRNLPLAYDRHPTWANLQGQQRRRGPNSFTRNFTMFHGLVMVPTVRDYFPVGFTFSDGFITTAPVPEITQLVDISQVQFPPLVDATRMPDAYRILTFAQKEKAKRLGSAVMTSPVTSHTGYSQTGLFNPDGASLYSQNWQMKLMPATRMDDPRQAGSDLAREATSAFDELAEQLRGVQNASSWDRVNAH